MLSHKLSHKRYFLIFPNNVFYNSLIQLVGTTGFEPATPCPPDKCATKLRYAPKLQYFFKTEGIMNTSPK